MPKDHGVQGCHSDVVRVLDFLCSGRRHCSVTIPDKFLTKEKPCEIGLSSFLSVEYECLPGRCDVFS